MGGNGADGDATTPDGGAGGSGGASGVSGLGGAGGGLTGMPVLMDLKATEARVEMAVMVLRRAPQVSMAAMVAVAALVVAR